MAHCLTHSQKIQLTIFLTSMCNLRCEYCYTESSKEQSKPLSIDIKFAKRGILDFFSNFNSSKIRFYGVGEPTQEIGLLREIRNFAYKLVGRKLNVEIQTNGVFSKDVAEWIGKYVDFVWVSLDGPPSVNDKLRPNKQGVGQTDLVLENITILKGMTNVGVRPTITKDTLPMMLELVEYYYSLGIKAICPNEEILPVIRYNKKSGLSTISTVPLIDFAKEFEKSWYRAQELGITFSSHLTFNFDEKSKYCCRACIPVPHLTIDGFVSACDVGLWGDSIHKELIIGKYSPSKDKIIYFNERNENLRRRSAQNLGHCDGCIAQYHCAGGCIGRTAHQTGSVWGQRHDFCEAVKYLAKKLPLNTKTGSFFHP